MSINPRCSFFSMAPVVLLATVLFACGGSGSGYSEPPPPPPPPPGNGNGNGDPEATLQHLQATIFSPICAQCHIGAGAPEGLRLDSEQNSFDHLVNQNAQGVPSLLRVNPGDPDNSYIVRKLEGGPGIVGDRMPQGLPPLSSAQINLIREWIANGAPREGTGESAAASTGGDDNGGNGGSGGGGIYGYANPF